MSNHNKAADSKAGQSKAKAKQQSKQSSASKKQARGIGCGRKTEANPKFAKAPCEKVINTANNSWIVLGRDRPGLKLEGYGGKGDSGTGMIDLVVGRAAELFLETDEKGKPVKVNPQFRDRLVTPPGSDASIEKKVLCDAARIYISQKTDVDDNFGLAHGKVGNSKTRSAIAMKADGIRIMSREGIKLVTGVDAGKNSLGGIRKVIYGIDLIAGNEEALQEETELGTMDWGIDEISRFKVQPLVKGKNLIACLNDLYSEIAKLNGMVEGLTSAQISLNKAVSEHRHVSPFFGAMTAPSVPLVSIGLTVNSRLAGTTKPSLANQHKNLSNPRGGSKMNFLGQAGSQYICSRYNRTN